MKRTLVLGAIALIVTGTTIFLGAGCSSSSPSEHSASSQTDQKAVQYTCSMHPEVVQDKPGDCPKCGMKLVEKH